MGMLYKGVCYADVASARVDACSNAYTSSLNGSNLVTAECTNTSFTAATMAICRRTNGGACTNSSTPWPVFQSCDYDGVNASAGVWFGVALTLFIVAFFGKKMIKLFDSNHQD
jgi:hypothetical protein